MTLTKYKIQCTMHNAQYLMHHELTNLPKKSNTRYLIFDLEKKAILSDTTLIKKEMPIKTSTSGKIGPLIARCVCVFVCLCVCVFVRISMYAVQCKTRDQTPVLYCSMYCNVRVMEQQRTTMRRGGSRLGRCCWCCWCCCAAKQQRRR